MRLKTNIQLFLCLLIVSLCSFTLAAEPMLNGIAVHSELGKEQFIGALYSNTLSDNADTLTSSTQPMRMELKIVNPDGMATRRFSRMWIEGMAINNVSSLLTEQADNMVKFDGLFKGRLIQGDDVVFSYEPNKGVNVFVNDVLLGNIASEKFFSMLLRTWIGKVPLSSEYKDSILKVGNVNGDLKARFEKIKPTKDRSTEIASWAKGKNAAELAAEKDKEKEKDKDKSSSSSSSENTKQLAIQKAELLKAEQAKAEAARQAAAKKAAEEEEKPALTAQTLLARQFYVSDLLKKIRINTYYPKRSLERNQAGSVRISVIVNRQGNVVSTTMLQSSEFDLLNTAAMQAITSSAPFPPMPDAIPGDTFEFNVPTTFTIPKSR